jgi:UTP--glucose-1-phosphate uridylyltransferase
MEVGQADAEGFSNSGRVDITQMEDNIYRIVKFHPKGKGAFIPRFKGELRTCGMAITGPHIFTYIDLAREKDKGVELTDGPIRRLMIKERTIVGCRLPGCLFDVGNPRGYSLCLEYINSNDGVQ